jgi:hypothetical protein
MIDFDLNTNESEALLRHCRHFVPSSNDPREDRRLEAALEALHEALMEHLRGGSPCATKV